MGQEYTLLNKCATTLLVGLNAECKRKYKPIAQYLYITKMILSNNEIDRHA